MCTDEAEIEFWVLQLASIMRYYVKILCTFRLLETPSQNGNTFSRFHMDMQMIRSAVSVIKRVRTSLSSPDTDPALGDMQYCMCTPRSVVPCTRAHGFYGAVRVKFKTPPAGHPGTTIYMY